MKLTYIDSLSNIDGLTVDLYETESGFFRYRVGNYVSGMFSGYDHIVRFLMKRGFKF